MKNRTTLTGLDIIKCIIGDKWKFLIVFHLFQGSLRYGELLFYVDSITKKVLTDNLKELENLHILTKTKIIEQNKQIAIYTLTDIGISLKPLFSALVEWGVNYQNEYKIIQKDNI